MIKSGTTLKYLEIYLKNVYKRSRKKNPKIRTLPADLFVWVYYPVFFIMCLVVSWMDGWLTEPIITALTVGGYLIILQVVYSLLLAFLVIRKDLLDECGNIKPQSPITLKEIINREIDFERWC